jgi:EAL domain-containing protein (putative c-di-GMP-specific phosphodiesterase class I)
MPPPAGPGPSYRWYLESRIEGTPQRRRVAVHPLPFRVGRNPGVSLRLDSDAVSKEHAEFFARGDALMLRDLGSRNGTLVNGEVVGEVEVKDGDSLLFAREEFRLGRQEIREADSQALEPPTARLQDMALPQHFVEGTKELPALLRERQVSVVFQPIVSLPSGTPVGYEALGRGRHPRLPIDPLDLFRVATAVGREAELSRVFRERALEIAQAHDRLSALFVNVHHAELERPGDLVAEIAEARQRRPRLRLTLEVNEHALANLQSIGRLQSQLRHSGVGIAYDDFGSDQARLLELAEVPPYYLKFAMDFVRGIDEAGVARQRLLTSLVSFARELLVYTVAQGVETAREADVCMRIGFTHGQGFYFGRPRPAEEI